MADSRPAILEKVGFILVLPMVLLQAFYAIYAYLDPVAFAALRGTELFAANDTDWVKIYASRTLFVAMSIGYLLYLRNYSVLVWIALIGVVMPLTDGLLAYQAQAPAKVIAKHAITVVYLVATFVVLRNAVRNSKFTRLRET
jgi:hypothetical protein